MNKFTLAMAGIIMCASVTAQTPQNADVHGSRGKSIPSGVTVSMKNGYTPNPAAVLFTDDMDNLNDTTSLQARGYYTYWRGTGVMGTTAAWFQGNATVFPDYNGVQTDGYVGANYNTVTGANDIDNWLVLPDLDIETGDTISFWSNCPAASTWPDSIRVMYNATGATLPEDVNWVELGRYQVAPTGVWERHFYTAPANGTTARFAIRYAVADGGPSGNNSNYIGIDQIDVIEAGGGGPSCPVAHDCCVDAADITSIFGGAVGVKQTLGPYNNDTATTGLDDPALGWACFGEPDGGGAAPSLENTLWFTFVGDGGLYFIETDDCGSPAVANYIDDGDTQLALYSGGCGTLNPLVCNEDGPQATSTHYPVGINFQTTAGVTYYIMIDGFNFNGTLSTGNFCISVTAQTSFACGATGIAPGTGTPDKNCVEWLDTVTVTIAGAVPPTQGTYHGFSWLLSTADISGNSNPLLDPSFVGGTGIAAAGQNVTLVNNGNPFTPGVYYFTPVVYGNATDDPNPPNPPTSVFHLVMDPNCTYTGTSIMIELKASGQACPSSIGEINSNYSAINVYPAPVNELANFDVTVTNATSASVIVKDQLGKVVYNQETALNTGVNKLKVDVSAFSKGVYFVTVLTSETNYAAKFVKQ